MDVTSYVQVFLGIENREFCFGIIEFWYLYFSACDIVWWIFFVKKFFLNYVFKKGLYPAKILDKNL